MPCRYAVGHFCLLFPILAHVLLLIITRNFAPASKGKMKTPKHTDNSLYHIGYEGYAANIGSNAFRG